MKSSRKLLALSFGILTGCGGPGLLASEPMGKQLERALKEIEKECRERGAPPFGPGSSKYNDTSCLMFTLKPWEPGDTPESAFAHSINLPPPHDKPRDVYKPGMSSEEYFNALCKDEAGEWVFRTVQGVRGIRQERPKLVFPLGYSGLVFFAVEKAHYMDSDLQEYFVATPIGRYHYLEIRSWPTQRLPERAGYLRFSRGSSAPRMETQVTVVAESNYAFIWRGIRRLYDRENAIDGYEIVVYQVSPFEVLAVQRGFSYRFIDKGTRDVRTPWGNGCTGSAQSPPQFVERVLIPPMQR